MKLDTRQLELIRNSLKDFEYIKTEINYLIEKGRNLENILDYLIHINELEIIHFDFDNEDFKYIDFTYGSIDNSVIEDKKGLRVQNTIEIYDKELQDYLIEDWLSPKEWQNILDKGEI